MKISKTHHVTRKGIVRRNPDSVPKRGMLLQDGSQWVVVYAEGTKAQQFNTKKEAMMFKRSL